MIGIGILTSAKIFFFCNLFRFNYETIFYLVDVDLCWISSSKIYEPDNVLQWLRLSIFIFISYESSWIFWMESGKLFFHRFRLDFEKLMILICRLSLIYSYAEAEKCILLENLLIFIFGSCSLLNGGNESNLFVKFNRLAFCL